MSTDDRIAILEALLARVKSRSRDGARTNGAKPHIDDKAVFTSADVFASAPPSPFDAPTPMAAFRPSPVPPPPSAPEHRSRPPSVPKFQRPEAPPLFSAKPVSPLFSAKPEAPPTRAPSEASLDQTLVEMTPPTRRAPPRPEPSGVRAVEPPPMEVIELDVDPDPSMPPPSVSPISGPAQSEEALESRSRLVSAPPAAVDSIEALDDHDLDDDAEDEDEEPFALSVPPSRAASDPTIEAAPVEVSQAEMDAIEAADRAPSSSRRPISMEDKMSELEEDSTPLHTPPPESGKLPAASPAIELTLDAKPASAPVPIAAPALAREALRPDPLPQTEVAVFVGRTPSDLPAKTFGDLLDATLAL